MTARECRALVAHKRDEVFQAWCPICLWDGPNRDQKWQANRDRDAHNGLPEPEHPAWRRGPG